MAYSLSQQEVLEQTLRPQLDAMDAEIHDIIKEVDAFIEEDLFAQKLFPVLEEAVNTAIDRALSISEKWVRPVSVSTVFPPIAAVALFIIFIVN